MKKYIGFTLLALVWILFSCSNDDDKIVTYCIDFDLRQCGRNPWLTGNQIPDSDQEHIELITEFLKKKDISVIQGEIDNGFHSIVCQACFECPAGPRIRVGVFVKDTSAIYALNLLNVTTVECPDEF